MAALTRALPPLFGTAELRADSLDRDERTVEVVFYTGAAVLRVPFFDDPYELEFEMTKKAANFARLNAGAPLIDSHAMHRGIESILGVVEKAWLVDSEARARVRFSKNERVEPIWRDVLDGVIRNISMGTYILSMEEVTKPGADMPRFRATSWEPYEISLVPVPADAGARVLQAAASAVMRPCSITTLEKTTMRLKKCPACSAKLTHVGDCDLATCPECDVDLDAAETQRDEFARQGRIQKAARFYGCSDSWSRKHIDAGSSVETALDDAAAQRAARAPQIIPNISMGTDYESAEWRNEQMASALASRALRKPIADEAKQYAKKSMTEMALECLQRQGKGRGLHPRHDASEIMSSNLALHSTSDFPLLLLNVLNKTLSPAYTQATPTYRRISVQRNFNDFRAHHFAKSGDFPIPLEVQENGEFKSGTMGEGKEIVSAVTYGRILGLSRQILINDDLGAFADIATKAGRRVADFENATFFATCITVAAGLGPTLVEGGVAVFNAAHNNLTAGGALSNTLLGEALSNMMQQTSLDGLKLNIQPRILLVPTPSLVQARTLLTAITPNQASQINPFAGQLEALSDANLGTGTRFYVFADPGQAPNYVYGFVGAEGPRTEVRNGFNVDGIEFKLALDFGCGAIDFRGGVTGAGV